MNIIIMILVLNIYGFEYKERLPIIMRTCKWPKSRERAYDQVIKEELILFSRLSFLRQFQSNFQQNDNLLKILEDLSKVKEQSALINSELVEKIREYKPEELTQYKSNKDPDDLLVIECYDKIIDIEKKLNKIQNLLENIGGLYSQSFLDKIQSQKSKLIEIQTLLAKFDHYQTKDIQLELNQLNRDYNICYQETFPLIKVFQQDKVSLLKSEVISPFKISKTQKKKKNKKQNHQLTIALELNQKWEYKEYKPVQKSECANHKLEIEEDFLQFLKIQELFKFKQLLNNQNKIVNQLINFKDKYFLNNKIILEKLKTVSIKYSYTAQFPYEYDFSNPDSKQIQQIYRSYEEYQKEQNLMLKQIQSAFDLQSYLNENLLKDIKNLNDWINNYLNTKFNYQQDDVYKELQQINRDYQICGRGVERYDLFIQHNYKLNGKTIESQKETFSSKLDYNQVYNCKIDLSTTKHAIIRDYQHLDLLKANDIYSIYNTLVGRVDNEKVYGELSSLIKNLDLRFLPVEFKGYQSNYKPNDLQAVQAYERLLLINNRLTTFKNRYNEALKYLTFAEKNLKQVEKNFKEYRSEVNNLGHDTESYIKSYLKQNLEEYTHCTGKDFNEEYQIQKDQQFYNKQQIRNYMTSQIEVQETSNQFMDNNKNSQIFMMQLNQQWKYYEYEPILQSECKDELQEIKEDILQFQKIQTLFYYKKHYQQDYNILITHFLAMETDFIENAKKLLNDFQRYDFSKIIEVYKYPDAASYTQGPRGAYSYLYKVYESLIFIKNEYGQLHDLVKFNKNDFSAIRYNNKLLNEYLQEQFLYNEKEVEMELKQLYRDYEICTKTSYSKDSEANKQISRDPVVLTQKIQIKQKSQKLKKPRKNSQKRIKQRQ